MESGESGAEWEQWRSGVMERWISLLRDSITPSLQHSVAPVPCCSEGDGGKAGEAGGVGIGCWLCRRQGREGSAPDPVAGAAGRRLFQFRDFLGKHLEDEILAS